MTKHVDETENASGSAATQVMPRASWTITLEYKSNDGMTLWKDALVGSDTVTIQKKGMWCADGEQRPVDEILTLDLAAVMRMLHESGELVCPSGAKGVIDAFRDGWS